VQIVSADYLKPFVSVATILIGSLLALSSARGELLFSDSFDYPAGNLDGQGPPPGSPPGQGGWVASNHDPLSAEFGLDFPGILTAGNSAGLRSIFGTVSDEAYAAIGPVTPDIGIVWVGFLVREARPAVCEWRLRGSRSYWPEHHRSQRRHWHDLRQESLRS
jgi:hypothetical protein